MTSRRRLVLSAIFLVGSVLLAVPPSARSQTPPADAVTPEQVREFLKRLNGGQLPPDLMPYQDLLDQLRKQHPKLFDDVMRHKDDPKFKEWAKEQAKQLKIDPNSPPNVDELRKRLPDQPPPQPGPNPPDAVRPPPDMNRPPDGPPPQGKEQPRPRLDTPPTGRVPKPPGGPPLGEPEQFEDLARRLSKGLDPLADPFPDKGKTADQILREKRLQAVAGLWEQNIGPLDETPEVRRALFDLVEKADLTGPDGNSFWDALDRGGGDPGSLADWLSGADGGGSWNLPDLDLGSTTVGRWWSGGSNVASGGSFSGDWSGGGRSPRTGGGSTGMGSIGFTGGGSWLPVVLLAVIIFGGLLWWRFWYLRDPSRASDDLTTRLGSWPVHPRAIATREDLVRAFEYLSVLICGPAAKAWTHGTIARALAGLAATHADTARLLARLYELARYAPLDEPLTAAELAEGRRLVCELAGVSTA